MGGGIIGSGIARDAALRGLHVALVEKEDFGWGTTARSTRLIHGGLRYLEHYDFGLVREALRERRILIQNAPHLVAPLPFLLPVFRGRGRGKLLVRIGLLLYDVLARANLGRHHWWKRAQVIEREPTLDRPDLKGAFCFFDAQVRYPERVVVENVVDLIANGGTARNHTEAIGLVVSDRSATHVRVRDTITGTEGTIAGRFFLNVGGPWVTEVDSALGSPDPALTRRTKGIHLLVDRVTEHAMVLQCGDGERIIFIVPWGPYSLIGTTDTDYAGDNDTVSASTEDVQYLLDEANEQLKLHLTPQDVHLTWAGLRPLIPKESGAAGAVSRRHLVIEHRKRDGPDNLVSIVGGKITSYRHIAADILDHLAKRLGVTKRDPTASAPLPGGTPHDETDILRQLGALLPHHTDADVERLRSLYGARVARLVEIAHDGPVGHLVDGSRLTREEVRFAVQEEAAQTVLDVLLRRTMLGLERDMGLPVVDALVAEMAKLLGWDQEHQEAERDAYHEHVRRNRAAIDELTQAYTEQPPDPWYGKRVR